MDHVYPRSQELKGGLFNRREGAFIVTRQRVCVCVSSYCTTTYACRSFAYVFFFLGSRSLPCLIFSSAASVELWGSGRVSSRSQPVATRPPPHSASFSTPPVHERDDFLLPTAWMRVRCSSQYVDWGLAAHRTRQAVAWEMILPQWNYSEKSYLLIKLIFFHGVIVTNFLKIMIMPIWIWI